MSSADIPPLDASQPKADATSDKIPDGARAQGSQHTTQLQPMPPSQSQQTAPLSAPKAKRRAWLNLKWRREKKPTGLVGKEHARERFIPVSRAAILERLTRDTVWPQNELPQVRRFFRYLENWRHISYHARLLKVEALYLHFSPDSDTQVEAKLPPAEREARMEMLIDSISSLLERANYDPINETDLNLFLAQDSPHGLRLKVDLDEFDALVMCSRGAVIETVRQRNPKWLYLTHEERQIAKFSRLFMLLKLKPDDVRIREIMQKEGVDAKRARKELHKIRKVLPEDASSDHIYLKVFKNIPQADIEMMFPTTQIQFRLFDKIKLGITAGGGTLAGLFGTITKILAATNPVTLLIAVLGIVGLFVRQISAFFNTRNRYMMQLAQNLFFHNLANNRATLTLLSARAEEEDIKEEALLYCVLAKEPVHREELSELKAAIETYLKEEFKVDVDYEIADALERLLADGIVTESADGVLHALSPADASRLLDRLWDAHTNPDADPQLDAAGRSHMDTVMPKDNIDPMVS